MSKPEPKFEIGEVVILHPPHPSAASYRGMETMVVDIIWANDVEDAMHGTHSGWSYQTDIPAPPPTDLPEDQHDGWIWAEYDLRKKHHPGKDFSDLMAELNSTKLSV